MLSLGFEELVRLLESFRSPTFQRDSCQIVTTLLNKINFKIDASRVIVVAGTNGKGSVCAMLEQLLRDEGFRVGLFTSPHLIDITERIQINRISISRSDFVDRFYEAQKIANGQYLTRFEYLTLMALHHFHQSNVDYMIFEVGIGGRRDAVNAIPHETCVLTKIGMDHEELLGATLEEVAKEKIGIVNNPEEQRFIYLNQDVVMVPNSVREAKPVEPTAGQVIYDLEGEPIFCLDSFMGGAPLSLKGTRSVENACVALAVFQSLGYSPFKRLTSLKNTSWLGRMHRLEGQTKRIYLSGDHNPLGMESLKRLLEHYRYDKIYFVVGIGKNKNISQMLEILRTVPRSYVVLTETIFKPSNRGGESLDLEYEPDPVRAVETILPRMTPKDMLVVTGSLYLVGHFLKRFDLEKGDC